MTFEVYLGRALAFLFILLAVTLQSSNAQNATYGPHLWDKPLDPAIFEKRVNEQLDLAQKSVDQILAVKGPRTIENTLVPYDNAVQYLDTAGYAVGGDADCESRLRHSRSGAGMIQKVSAVATALALNQALYHALAALDVSKADPATQYYVQRTLLEFRLAGVDKDDATRARIKTLNDEITKYSTQFERNLQESQLKVVVKDPKELDGLPEDFIKAHKPAADGTITLTSDSPDVTPVLKFCQERRPAQADLSCLQQPRLSAERRGAGRPAEEARGTGQPAGLQALGRHECRRQDGGERAKHREVHRRDRRGVEARGRARIQDAAGGGAEAGPVAAADRHCRTATTTSSSFAAASSTSTRRRRGPTSPTTGCSRAFSTSLPSSST